MCIKVAEIRSEGMYNGGHLPIVALTVSLEAFQSCLIKNSLAQGDNSLKSWSGVEWSGKDVGEQEESFSTSS